MRERREIAQNQGRPAEDWTGFDHSPPSVRDVTVNSWIRMVAESTNSLLKMRC
jgi:hypothetical protein